MCKFELSLLGSSHSAIHADFFRLVCLASPGHCGVNLLQARFSPKKPFAAGGALFDLDTVCYKWPTAAAAFDIGFLRGGCAWSRILDRF